MSEAARPSLFDVARVPASQIVNEFMSVEELEEIMQMAFELICKKLDPRTLKQRQASVKKHIKRRLATYHALKQRWTESTRDNELMSLENICREAEMDILPEITQARLEVLIEVVNAERERSHEPV